MLAPPLHPDESARVAALLACGILDTPPEPDFDGLAAVAAELAGTPIALVSLIDGTRQWFKAHHGLDATETPRDIAFCAHAILDPDQAFIIEDANLDPRFSDNPLVTGGSRVIFYAGIPLRTGPQAQPIGTLCVIDHVPRSLPESKVAALRILGHQVEALLAQRAYARQLADALTHAATVTAELAAARDEALATTAAHLEVLVTVSHDLRSPLHSILGVAELLDATPDLTPGISEHANMIRAAGGGMLDLINNLLDAQRLSHGRLTPERIALIPGDELARALVTLAPQARQRGLTLVSTAAPGRVLGDPLRLRQVIANLVGNALKFTERGSISITWEPHGAAWRLTVVDSGIGMDADTVARLFRPFEQANAETARRYGGSGLGLSIVHGLVHAMQGSVIVTSTPGHGTTITVDLPLVEAPPASGPRPGLRVLIADDDTIVRRIAVSMLQRLGCVVSEAADGALALAAWQQTPYDAAVIDMQMPKINGATVLATLRAANPRMRLVAATGGTTDAERTACLASGANTVLTKPYGLADLATALSEN